MTPEEAGPAAPPWPHGSTVEWQVAGRCNYRCSYCIQSPAHRQGEPSAEELEDILAFLSSLPGMWEIKMTGGEPFACSWFLTRIVPALVATRHRISVLTNLSAATAVLRRFAGLCGGKLALVSASLHLEETAPAAFIERLVALRDAAAPSTRFVVNAVLVPGRLAEVRAAREAVEAAGFRFFPQLMKVKGGVHPYTPEQRREIDAVVGGWSDAERERTANLVPSYEGRRCWAGARYLVLAQHGDAWVCRSAKRCGEGALGHARTGISLHRGPVRCPYPLCPCAVPANRGMVEGVPARGLEAE